MTITLRATKGSSLSWQEMDDNFTGLKSNTIVLYTDLANLVFPTGSDAVNTTTFSIATTGGLSGVSVSTNTFTLPAGTYVMKFPMLTTSNTSWTTWFLYNVTDSQSVVTFDNPLSIFSGQRYTWFQPTVQFTIAGTKTFDFRKSSGLGTTMILLSSVGTVSQTSGNASLAFTIYRV
jgi:hypothetical protein